MIQDYLPNVQGWLQVEALLFTSFYRQVIMRDILFDSLEIGVHHGKFFIGIERLTPEHRHAFAVDIFTRQDLNVDRSGKGDLNIFRENTGNYCLDPKRIVIIESDSFDCRSLLPAALSLGIISIDGGHTVQHTINDMAIAHDLVHPSGLVVLDDILNPGWPGVIEGAIKFMTSNQCTRLLPFAIGFNKLFLTHFSNQDRALQIVQSESDQLASVGLKVDKVTRFCGADIAVIARSS